MTTTVAKHDNYNRQIIQLAIPIIIQNLLSAAVNSADVIMLNYVNQSAISAVSLAANYSNILFMVSDRYSALRSPVQVQSSLEKFWDRANYTRQKSVPLGC